MPTKSVCYIHAHTRYAKSLYAYVFIAQYWLSIYIVYIVVNVENFCISTVLISFLMDLSWIDEFRKDDSVGRKSARIERKQEDE